MAQFDLKEATVYVEDGYQLSGAVNNVAGYTAGSSTITVDGFVGAVETGIVLKFAGHETEYTVTDHTETVSDTTEIVIDPVLTDAIVDDEVITTGPHRLEVTIGEGNITFSEKRNIEYKRNRGKLNTVRKGDEEPMDVRIDFEWEFLKSSTGDPPTIEEALKRQGNASTWVSSSADTCEPFAVNIRIRYAPECSGEQVQGEDIVLPDYRYTEIAHDASAGTLSTSGQCNAEEAIKTRFDITA